MTSRISRARVFSILAAVLALFAALLAAAPPAQADDDDDHVKKLVSVSSWCGQYVRFTNRTSHEVDVSYEIVRPLSPFGSKEGDFELDGRESYSLKAYGSQKSGYRLYFRAEWDDHYQQGYVDQWKYCGRYLVKTYVWCGHVKFTNVFNHKVKVRYQEGPGYGYWDDDFRLRVGRSKTIEFDSSKLWFTATSQWGDDHYRRQNGAIYQPKYCDEYEDYKKKHDDDDDYDEDEYDLHDSGDFMLKILPFTGGPLLDSSVPTVAANVGVGQLDTGGNTATGNNSTNN
jgi:hypothetical protein